MYLKQNKSTIIMNKATIGDISRLIKRISRHRTYDVCVFKVFNILINIIIHIHAIILGKS